MVRGRPRDEYQSALDTLDRDVENGRVAEADAAAIKTLCAAFDPEDATESLPTGLYDKRKTKHVKDGTRAGWVERLRVLARDVELTSETTTADDINAFTTGRKKAGDSTSHVRNIEHAASKFYRFYDNGVDVDAITVHEFDTTGDNGWDERDLLDADERAALRDTVDNARDRAVYHLLLYCGMRNTALRTLRVRDIDLENHEWYFNTSDDGLKHVHSPNEPRPLFQAEKAVRDWLENHPTGEPGHYLITGRPRYTQIDPTEPVTRETVRRCIDQLKKESGVSEPCTPTMLRHNFVSMCRKHPDIDDADIKFYLGHAPGSNVMEETYSHLSSEDHNTAGHSAMGVEGAGDGGGLTEPWDTTCRNCDRVLAPQEDTCDVCETPREETPWDDPQTPDDQVRTAVRELLKDPDPEDFQAGLDISKTINEMVREKIEDEMDQAIEEHLAAAGFVG